MASGRARWKIGFALASVGFLLLWATGEELARGYWLSPRDLKKWGHDESPHPLESNAAPVYQKVKTLVYVTTPFLYLSGIAFLLLGTAIAWGRRCVMRKWHVVAALTLFLGGFLLSTRALWGWYDFRCEADWWTLFGLDGVKTMISIYLLGLAASTLGVVLLWERILRGEGGVAGT